MARTKASAKGKGSPKSGRAVGGKGLAKKASAKKGGKAAPKRSTKAVSSDASSSVGASRSRSASRSGSGSRSASRSRSTSRSGSGSRASSPAKPVKAKGRPKSKAAKSPKAKRSPKAAKSPKVPTVLKFHGKGKAQYAQYGDSYIASPQLICYKQQYKDESKEAREIYKLHGLMCDKNGNVETKDNGEPKKTRHMVLSADNLAIANKHGLKCKPKEIKPYKERAPKGTKKTKGKDPLRGQKLTAKMIRALLRVYITEHGADTLNANIEHIRREFATKKRGE